MHLHPSRHQHPLPVVLLVLVSHVSVGNGLCMPLGIRVYDGDGDNEGTAQERTDRCAAACFHKRTPLAYGPWSSRGGAVGFGLGGGRCYCNHAKFASCPKAYASSYKAYEFRPGKSLVHPAHG